MQIFGSRALGTFKPGSNIDIAIMTEGISSKTIRRLLSDLEESSIPYRIDLVNFPTFKHAALRSHIAKVGKVIYKKKISQE